MGYCDKCPLNNTSPKIKDTGNKSSGIIFLSDSPCVEDSMSTKSPKELNRNNILIAKLLDYVGVPKETVVVANIIKCAISSKMNTKTIKEAMCCCKPYLDNTIAIVNPKLIVALGERAFSYLYKKKSSISKVRGKIFNMEDYLLLPTLHALHVLKTNNKDFPNIPEPKMFSKERLILKDFTLIKTLLKTDFNIEKSVQKIPIDSYILIKDGSFINFFNSKAIAFDLEWDKDILLCTSVTDTEGKAFVNIFRDNTLPKTFKNLMGNESVVKIVANRPVDEIKLLEYGCEVKGTVHDVFLMGHLIDETSDINLQNLANTYTSLNNIKDLAGDNRANLSEVDTTVLANYAGVDADATFRVYNQLNKRLQQDTKLYNYYTNFLQPVSNLLVPLAAHGCKIDIPKLKLNEAFLKAESNKICAELLNFLPQSLKEKYQDNLSINRPALLIDYLFTSNGINLKPVMFTGKTKQPSTAENHLVLFKDNEFVKSLLEYKKINKLLSTYISSLYNCIAKDGRIYPQTFLYRTVTGRTAMTNPPIQQIPQRGSQYVDKIRELFIADEGYKIIATDLSQSEIRIMAWQANEQKMLNAFANKIDIHTLTASIITGKAMESITKQERQSAKGVNFGFLYGMLAKSFVTYSKEEYGINITLEQAEDFKKKYFQNYPAIANYHARIKRFVTDNGYVYSPLGRVRRLPNIYSTSGYEVFEAERQAINLGIQSFSTDLGLLGMYLFWEAVKRDTTLYGKVKLLWYNHDAIFIQAQEDKIDKVVSLLRKCLTVRTKEYIYKKFNIVVNYPIEAETVVGDNWANLKPFNIPRG